jgi:SPP1 gp7 family putative phage head morphogenesis protein
MNANTLIYNRQMDRATMIKLYEEHTTKKVNLIIDGHIINIDNLIKNSKLQGTGFKGFQKDLDAIVKKTFDNLHTTTSKSFIDLFNQQVGYTTKSLSKAAGNVWRPAVVPRMISEDFVLSQPLYQNTTLKEGWDGIARNEKIRIEAILRKSIADGLSEEAAAKAVLKAVPGITKNQATGLVVTATTAVYVEADHQVYKMNAKALQGWQFVAILDARTTTTCANLNGKVFPVSDTEHLPPRHWYCRSTTTPVVKSYEQLGELEGVAQIRKRNLAALTDKEKAFYDGETPLIKSYDSWLRDQPPAIQLKHLGDTKKLEAYRAGQLTVDKFKTDGKSVGINELNAMTSSGYGIGGDTRRFALAKEKLDALKIGASRPEDFYIDPELTKNLREYYLLQAGELDGTLSLTNYRGTLLHNKKNTKARVLSQLPTEDNLKFNPITGRYDDSRMYQPNPQVLANTYKLVNESAVLKGKDKKFITDFVDSLETKMGVNERAVITDNLRITFSRFRENKEPWNNMKAVLQGQIKFDIMNVSDYIETQIRKDANLLMKLKQDNYLDPVLGPTQLQSLHDNFIRNIYAKNKWEDKVAPKIASELQGLLDFKIPLKIKIRLSDRDLDNFYLKFARRLSLADSPDRDQLAVALGRDLYNLANYRGSRNEWFNLGVKLLDDANNKGFYELESFGVQKRRMKSRNFGKYFL